MERVLVLLISLALASALPQQARAQAGSDAPATDVASEDVTEMVVAGRSWPQGRLGDSVRPVAYRLDLTVDPAQPRFSGHVEIDVMTSRPETEIVLHGRGLAVRSVSVRWQGGQMSGVWTQIDGTGTARIDLEAPLPAGAATLLLDYDAPFLESPAGLFRTQVGGQWYAWSQFEAIDARAAFPSFDQPGFKTPFAITIQTPKGLSAVSNGAEIGLPATAGEGEIHRFAPTAPLPTYLVAIMVGPFAQQGGVVPPTAQRPTPLPLRILTPQPNAALTGYALQGTAEIVSLTEAFFGSAHPFDKLDQITTPLLPGAMENAGAVLYRDDILLVDRTSSAALQRDFGEVVAHEIAHQWFGNLVTPAWWDDLWLNESFANWLGYRIGDAWRPELGIGAGALVEGFAAMETDALLSGRPVRQPIRRSDEIDSAFDAITYGKGGHVVGMIASYLGADRFRDGVRRYVEKHRFGSATSDDFFAALAESSGDIRVGAAMRSLVELQGVPMLVMRREGDRVLVSQRAYVHLGTDPPETLWSLPVCMRRGDNRVCRIMTHRTESFRVPGEGPIVPNAGGEGYYRFELSERHWSELIQTADTLPASEAIALVDSLYGSILAGRGTVSEMTRLARKLARHPDWRAASAPDAALSRLVRTGIVDAPGRAGFFRLRDQLYFAQLRRLGFDPRAGVYRDGRADEVQRRAQLLASVLGAPRGGKLRKLLSIAAQAYLAGDSSALDPAWLDHGLDLHIYFGGDEAARALVEMALTSDDMTFRPAALAAAARTGRKETAAWLLGLRDPRLRESERRDFLSGIMARSTTRELGYAWIVRNLESLLESNDSTFLTHQLPSAISQFCSVEKAKEMAADLRLKLAGTPAALAMDRALETVRNCGILGREMGSQINLGFGKLR